MKTIIVLALVGILAALASAGVFMLKRPSAGSEGGTGKGRESRMAWALAVRVGLSVALFAFILLAYALGWVQPSGIPVGR